MFSDEEQEIRSLSLVRTIARFTEPGQDADDDADTLRSLIAQARAIVGDLSDEEEDDAE